MKTILKSTEVRKEWSSFIDDVIRESPALVKRNRDLVAVLSVELLDYILSEYKLTVEVKREKDGSYSGVFNEIDIMANAMNLESLEDKLANELIEYSEEYMNEFKMHYYSSNRKDHFPFVYRVSLYSGDMENIKRLFSIKTKPIKKAS
ncbi:hypothetical protein ACFLQQ_00240 [Actinomycetota bacterium]